MNEGLLVWYRLLFSATTVWAIFLWQKKIQKISFRDMMTITGVGLVTALHWVAFYGSIKYSNVSVALVCFSSIGFFTALTEPLLLKQKFALTEFLLGLLVIAGIYVIFHFDTHYKTGIIIGIIAAFLAAIFPILNRKLLQRFSVETLTAYELTGGLLTLSLLMPVYLHLFPVQNLLPSFSDLTWLLCLSWICTVWAFQLAAYALKKISAFTVNLTYNLEPVYGILLAFVVFKENEHLGWNFYAGLVLIVLAVFLQMLRIYRSRSR